MPGAIVADSAAGGSHGEGERAPRHRWTGKPFMKSTSG
jgi:hypothetical protein